MTGTINATVREIIDRVYPVGIILDFATETNPNEVIGCGTVWTRIEDGRALIASSAAHAVGSTCGAETVVLTEEQLPSHSHTIGTGFYDGVGGYGVVGSMSKSQMEPKEEASWSRTGTTGGGQPHSSMQPSLAVCRWKRTA